jgi:hypothetical protein
MKTIQRNPPETLFHNVWVKKQTGLTTIWPTQSSETENRTDDNPSQECIGLPSQLGYIQYNICPAEPRA